MNEYNVNMNDKVIILSYSYEKWSVFLTIHLSLEELDQGLSEGLNPFVHDVVTRLCCVFIVQELSANVLKK